MSEVKPRTLAPQDVWVEGSGQRMADGRVGCSRVATPEGWTMKDDGGDRGRRVHVVRTRH
jgi:hypothetical protein